jgi:hypothetical protein
LRKTPASATLPPCADEIPTNVANGEGGAVVQ